MWRGSSAFLLLVLGYSAGDDPPPTAQTRLGNITGSWATSRSGRKFAAFETIPYAVPPLGDLRFQDPKQLETKWSGTYNAARDLPSCVQFNPIGTIMNTSSELLGQEDCLYLSVFTHSLDQATKAPVLVHFHGGAFNSGSGKDYGPEYLMDEDIVIVRAQYRVGVFGFLSLEEDIAPGNQGMKDQTLSLHWVQENVANFGGDPSRVTIIGESAGGASVYHHIVSPLSRGLFHKAISESGTSYCSWAVAVPGEAKSKALEMFQHLNCSTNTKEGLACARNKTIEELMKVWQTSDKFATPVLEKDSNGSFLIGPIKDWKQTNVSLLIGMTSGEGQILLLRFLLNDEAFITFSKDFAKDAAHSLGVDRTSSTPQEVTKKVLQFYNLENKNITKGDLVNITKMISDAYFSIGILDGANNHAGDTYMYYFDYVLNFLPIDPNLGSFHASESLLLWKKSTYVPKDKDEIMSKYFVKIVGKFIQNGKPSLEGSDWTWDKWTKANQSYIRIDKDGFHKDSGLLEERYKFWNGLNYRDMYDKDGGSTASVCSVSVLLIALVIAHVLY